MNILLLLAVENIRNRLILNQQKQLKLLRINQLYNRIQMNISRKTSNKPSKYAKIPLQARINLIDLVLNHSNTISYASKKLCIKESTAKMIVKRYKSERTYFQRRSDRQKRANAIDTEKPNQQQMFEQEYAQRAIVRENYSNLQYFTALYHPTFPLYADNAVYYIDSFSGCQVNLPPGIIPCQYYFNIMQ